MKILYIILLLPVLIACDENTKVWPAVSGEVYNRDYYMCEFGVLYDRGYGVAFIGRDGNPIQCENVYLTKIQYCNSVKPKGAVFYGCPIVNN